MKILVVDDEQRFGALVCRSLRKLGHEALLALHPEDALATLQSHPDVDAVITDIDMPAMSGVELAAAIRARHDIPIAFCTGSSPGQRVLSEAAALGKVLTSPWSLADMGALVGDLERRRARPGAGRGALTVHLATWEEVLRLCERRDLGPARLTTPAPGDVDDALSVTLRLPDGFSVVVDGEVVARKVLSRGDALELIVELGGLTIELAARLRALAAPRRSPPIPETPELSRVKARLERIAAGTPVQELEREWAGELARGSGDVKVSDLLLSNERLKAQIEGLAANMRPRGSDEGDDDAS